MLNNEKRYLISRFVNLIGNSIYNICIPLYLLEKFESLMITGAFFTLVQIPMVVLLPFIGSYLKNKNLKHTMLASNVISVVIFMMVFINEQFFSSSFILFMILTMLEKINVAIFNISSQSAFPILFEKTDIDEINSLKSVLDNFAALLGPTLGTVIYSKGGFSAVVGINILSFALCFLMLLHLKYIDKCGLSYIRNSYYHCTDRPVLDSTASVSFYFFLTCFLNDVVYCLHSGTVSGINFYNIKALCLEICFPRFILAFISQIRLIKKNQSGFVFSQFIYIRVSA